MSADSIGIVACALVANGNARTTAVVSDYNGPIMDIVSAAIVLLLVMDPFGNIPLVLTSMQNVPAARRARVVRRECGIAFMVLLAFLFGGQLFLSLLGLTENALEIAGGVILFLIALRMVFPHPEGIFGERIRNGIDDGEQLREEPFIVPIAIPAIAGPSALATVMLLVSRDPARWPHWLAALALATVVSLVILLSAERIARWVGRRGITAMERLMGLVLTAIAIQMLLSGIEHFIVGMR
jgi:MarC family membrane protein